MGKLLLDFAPVVLFFVVYKMYDDSVEGIIAATIAAIIGSIVQVTWTRLRHGRVEKMHLITLALIVVLGGLTVAFRNEIFIKWKPSLVNWAFALAFLGAHFIGKKTLVQRMMGGAVTLPERIWRGLDWAWIIFFIAIGLINIAVAYSFDTDTWVNFKLFGMLGITLVFVLAQSLVLSRFIEDDPPAEDSDVP